MATYTIVNSKNEYLINKPEKGYTYSKEDTMMIMKFDSKSKSNNTLNFFKTEANNQDLFWKKIIKNNDRS